MKKTVLLLCAAVALIMYSCSTDREEQTQAPVSEKLVPKLKKETINKTESAKIGDSTIVSPQTTMPGSSFDPEPGNPDPNEGGDPINLPPRK